MASSEATPGEATPGGTPPGEAPRSILITRPEGQAGALSDGLQEAGYRVHHIPMLELQAVEKLPPEQCQRVIDLDLYQHIIFVSANAVRFSFEYIENYWPQLPLGINWYAVGSGTARLLADYGLEVIAPGGDMSSEGLLALPQLTAPADQRVLIVRGEGGRTLLQRELSSRGARVDTLETYRRCPPRLSSPELIERLEQWQIDVVMISSGEGLANFLSLLRPQESTNFRDTVIIVPSRRVAELAGRGGFSRVITAANASDQAMMAALEEWKHSAGD